MLSVSELTAGLAAVAAGVGAVAAVPKNTDVDSLFLLQGIFLTKVSKRGLLFLKKLEIVHSADF